MVFKLTGIVSNGKQGSTQWMPEYFSDLFPGTLNIMLDFPVKEIEWDKKYFHKTFNRYFYTKACKINGISAYLILPPLCTSKSHTTKMKNPNLAEIGHKEKLRKLLALETGDRVIIEYEGNSCNDT